MAERPILFSGPMVRAILAGTKTQTRRMVKEKPPASGQCLGDIEEHPDHEAEWFYWFDGGSKGPSFTCPYGNPGDRLGVREAWAVSCAYDSYPPRDLTPHTGAVWYASGGGFEFENGERGISRPSIFMPRWASRITLEVTEVRVQRLHDITEEDAKAEGAEGGCENCGETTCHIECVGHKPNFRDGYAHIWMKINGEASWHANPWVWAITFKQL